MCLTYLTDKLNIKNVANVSDRITRAIKQTRESERCSSTSIQLVQLPTQSNIPGASMVRHTGDSEYRWYYRADNGIRAM